MAASPRKDRSASSQPSRPPRKRSALERYYSQRFPNADELPIVHPQAAGIDLGGRRSHFVATGDGSAVEVKEFGRDTAQLLALAQHLQERGVQHVAMEATGVYWIPVYDLLEARGLRVCLVNPCHARHVPGRPKTDKMDCRWLRKLHLRGLLSPSFRPAQEIRPVRSLLRCRARFVQEAADAMRRLQKVLDMMNLHPHKLLADLGGETGRRIQHAMVAGVHDPAVLAGLRDRRCAHPEAEFREALTGFYREEYLAELELRLELYEKHLELVRKLDAKIETHLQQLAAQEVEDWMGRLAADTHPLPEGKHAPHFNAAGYVTLLTGRDPTQLPGIGPQSALQLFAELGRDLSPWPSVKHFTSYLTLAPQLKISGGKVLSSHTRPGTPPAAVIFRQAAASVIQQEDSALAAHYRRLAGRAGKGKALTAIARKLAEMYYYLMKEGHAYVEQGAQAYEERYRKRRLRWLQRHAEQLHCRLEPILS